MEYEKRSTLMEGIYCRIVGYYNTFSNNLRPNFAMRVLVIHRST